MSEKLWAELKRRQRQERCAVILEVLRATRSVKATARLLGIHRNTVHNELRAKRPSESEAS